MKAFVITIKGNDYSEACAQRCIASAKRYGVEVEKFEAVAGETAVRNLMESCGLQWSWPNVEPDICPYTRMRRHIYKTAAPYARMGCALSHFLLWQRCLADDAPYLILEHDAVFVRGLPEMPAGFGAVMLNNPEGATPRGGWWKKQIEAKGPGVHRKTKVFDDERPDGLAGNSAYIISPKAAHACINAYERYGVWPNDATLCRQLVGNLMEVYPFVTEVRQTQSTSGGY